MARNTKIVRFTETEHNANIMFIGGSDIVNRISFEKISLQFWRFNYFKPPLFERGGGLRKRSVGTKTEKLLRLYQK